MTPSTVPLGEQDPQGQPGKQGDGHNTPDQVVVVGETVSARHDDAQCGEVRQCQHGVAHAGSLDTGWSLTPNLRG